MQDNQEIKNLEYFKTKIKDMIKYFDTKGILTIDDRNIKEQ